MDSSPLTPGKPPPRAVRGADLRLIPAHAGKTRERGARRGCGPAHPRSRGENISATLISRPSRGSSPLTRGKHARGLRARCHRRLIPAHAGKTSRSGRVVGMRRAHPRSRGENRRVRPRLPVWRGSSPLTRGKLTRAAPDVMISRLIPAHAGKTRQRRSRG